MIGLSTQGARTDARQIRQLENRRIYKIYIHCVGNTRVATMRMRVIGRYARDVRNTWRAASSERDFVNLYELHTKWAVTGQWLTANHLLVNPRNGARSATVNSRTQVPKLTSIICESQKHATRIYQVTVQAYQLTSFGIHPLCSHSQGANSVIESVEFATHKVVRRETKLRVAIALLKLQPNLGNI